MSLRLLLGLVFATPLLLSSADVAKLKVEVLRLESLVKRLQAELVAERDYAKSLEEAVKTLQQV